MSQTLYRKYRPQTFADLAGQNHIRVTLQNQIKQDKVAHAYVFCGPRGVGKTTTARLLAKALNCTNRKKNEVEPCNTCDMCVAVTEGRALNMIEIDAASNTGVDHVREHIIANANVLVPEGQVKVFIIDEVHMLSTSSFNALLKTLEEPPPRVVFILATTEVHQLPDTILSRCQRFDFRKVDVQDLVTRLEQITKNEGINTSRDVLERIARHSGGHLRDAESVLWQLFGLGEDEITMEHADLVMPKSDLENVVRLFVFVMERKSSDAIELVNTILVEGGDLQQLTRDTIELLRKLMLLSVSQNLDQFTVMDVPPVLMKNLSRHLEAVTIDELKRLLEVWVSAYVELSNAEIIQLPLELAILESIGTNDANDVAAPSPPKAPEPEPSPSEPSPEPEAEPQRQEEPAETEKNAATPEAPAQKSVGGLQSAWKDFLSNVRKENHSLAITLGLAKILAEEDGAVTFGFGYQFHCDRVMQGENKVIIEKVIASVTGKAVKITATIEQAVRDEKPVDEDTVTPVETTDSDMVAALDVFGGKILQDHKTKDYKKKADS